MLYSGIDLHKRSVVIATVDERGQIVCEESVPASRHAVARYFQWLPEPTVATVEATSSSWCRHPRRIWDRPNLSHLSRQEGQPEMVFDRRCSTVASTDTSDESRPLTHETKRRAPPAALGSVRPLDPVLLNGVRRKRMLPPRSRRSEASVLVPDYVTQPVTSLTLHEQEQRPSAQEPIASPRRLTPRCGPP